MRRSCVTRRETQIQMVALCLLLSGLVSIGDTRNPPLISERLVNSICSQFLKWDTTGAQLQPPLRKDPGGCDSCSCAWYFKGTEKNYERKTCQEIDNQISQSECIPPVNSRQGRKSFKGYQVWKIKPETLEQEKVMLRWKDNWEHYDFWTGPHPPPSESQLMVSPEAKTEFQRTSQAVRLKPQLLIADVEDATVKSTRQSINGRFDLYNYNPWNVTYTYLKKQETLHPGIAKVVNYGVSHECRPLTALSISKSNETKPLIFVEAGIHAREWISPAVSLNLIHHLLNEKNGRVAGWLDDFDFLIIPHTNVDGYAYTHDYNRLWRKTRSNPLNVSCQNIGVDANRNFDTAWGVGVSNSPCYDSYPGPMPGSEVEVSNFKKLIKKVSSRLIFFLSLHAFSQVIIIPYAYTTEKFPFYQEHLTLSQQAEKAIAVRRGTKYASGLLGQVLPFYAETGGTSTDWVKKETNTRLALSIELPPTMKEQLGFLLPPKQIKPVSLEILDGLQVYVDHLKKAS